MREALTLVRHAERLTELARGLDSRGPSNMAKALRETARLNEAARVRLHARIVTLGCATP
jgi:hypothetical protein